MKFKFFRGITKAIYSRDCTVWKTATGKHVPIKWMTNSHIINTLGCLEGVGNMTIPDFYMGLTKQQWIDVFKTELIIRHTEDL